MSVNVASNFHQQAVSAHPKLGPEEAIELTATVNNALTRSLNPRATAFVPRASPAQAVEESYPMYSWSVISPQVEMRYIRDAAEADAEVRKLNEPLGFDMEWYSGLSFKGPQRKTAVIQICDNTKILIIQLSAMSKFPKMLKKIIESPHVIKMGVGVLGDGHKLRRDFGIIAGGLLELMNLVNLVDPPSVKNLLSLKNAVQRYTGYTLLKGVFEKSDWEAVLSPGQLEYAANDAYAALSVYNALLNRAREKGMAVRPVIVPNSLGIGINYIEDWTASQPTNETAE